MKSLVIAEKPSVGRDIARVLGCKQGGNGCLEGRDYVVTWALGHLIELSDPESYGEQWKVWKMETLPMLPEKLEIQVIKKTSKQYQAVKAQMHRKDIKDIVIATDAGREGELVARWIIKKAGVKKPMKRLWISSVTDKAIRQGLAAPGVDYSHKDILNFLLMPGFSTNTEVTEYSGRGVGMDVVKSNVEAVGGMVSISSEKGFGMTTTLKIPLTMAIMDGMEVSVGESVLTVPINNIRQILKVTSQDVIHDATKGEMIEVMDNFYSIVRAKEFYQMDSGIDEFDDGILLWVESGENSFCLFVDELIGQQKVVVKPLPDYVNDYGIKNYGVTGCTILGNGDISIILDVASIYTASHSAGM